MKARIIISALTALTLVGCGLLDSDDQGGKGHRLTFSDTIPSSWKVEVDDSGERRYFVMLSGTNILTLKDSTMVVVNHWPDSSVISFYSDTGAARYNVSPTACTAKIEATGHASSGLVNLTLPLTFESPVRAYQPTIDTIASAPPSPYQVDWAGLPISGTYTIDCPDPR